MQELLAKDDVSEENQKVPQFNKGINPNNTINLNDFSQSFGPSNSIPCHTFVNLGSDFDFTTLMKPNTNPTHGATNTCPTHAIITTNGTRGYATPATPNAQWSRPTLCGYQN